MRRHILLLLFAAFPWMDVVFAQNESASPPAVDEAPTRSVSQVIDDVSGFRPGMTRARLSRVFTTEGGLSSRSEQQYVYRRCHYIKIIAKFRKPGDADDSWGRAPEDQRKDDIIQSISHPFLEYAIAD